MTAAFAARWANHSERKCLVYSTGRTLEQYQELKEEKGKLLHEPDYLITAVGTRVYSREKNNNKKDEWREDPDWTAQLGRNWCTETVLRCVEAIIERAGEDSAHLRPKHEQNEHKITLGMKSDRVEGACLELRRMLGERGVEAKLVYSGSGEWKYLDVLSKQAGKRSSLDFVRRKTKFSKGSTVAAGDSGNDIDFMEGENRAIIVGNAQGDLVGWYQKALALSLSSESDRKAFKDRVVFTEEEMAGGIVAGLESFNIF